jgi:hypothetical protein
VPGPTIGAERFDDAFLAGLRTVGDPPADTVVADYLDGQLGAGEGHLITELIAHGASSTDEASAPLRDFVNEQPAWPDWADPAMVRRGQDIFAERVPQLGLGLWMASLPAGYAGARGAEVLTHTTRLVSDAKRRFLETGQFIIDVMTPGGMRPDEAGARDIRHVRLMHASVRHLLRHHETAASAGFDEERFGVPVNQEDLLGTLFTFSVIGLQVLERSGIRLPDDDCEAYVHCWNAVGHGMGIREDLLPLDVADSWTVFERIQDRNYARSDAGVELTAAAIEVMQELLAARILRGVPAAGIRELLGDDVADLLEVPRARLSALAFVPARWFNAWSARREQDSKLARRMSQILGRRLFQGFLDLERDGRHRARFELDDALREQLGLA